MHIAQRITMIVMTVLAALFGYLYFHQKPEPVYDQSLMQARIDTLTSENVRYRSEITGLNKQIERRQHKYDSLERQKNQIKTLYVHKYKEIDAANVAGTIADLDSIFAKNRVR